MQTRKLGETDLELTTVGFGAWAIGGGGYEWGWGPQEDRDSIAAIHRAFDLGVNWVDTAPEYGLGRSEEVVGWALRGRRGRVYVATKCGQVWDDRREGKTYARLKAWSVRQEAEASLKRLGVDVIDLYQIHWPRPDEDIEEGWAEIARLVKEGKVRWAGVSNFSVAQIKRAQAIHPVASLQPEYNLLNRAMEGELLPFYAENKIGVLAYSPLGSGLLTGSYDRLRIASLPAEDWRSRLNEEFREPRLGPNLELVDGLTQLAREFGRGPGELAVAWVLRRPEVTAAIVGARRPEQIELIAPAADWSLPAEALESIEALLARREARVAAERK